MVLTVAVNAGSSSNAVVLVVVVVMLASSCGIGGSSDNAS